MRKRTFAFKLMTTEAEYNVLHQFSRETGVPIGTMLRRLGLKAAKSSPASIDEVSDPIGWRRLAEIGLTAAQSAEVRGQSVRTAYDHASVNNYQFTPDYEKNAKHIVEAGHRFRESGGRAHLNFTDFSNAERRDFRTYRQNGYSIEEACAQLGKDVQIVRGTTT